ncbi:hypothetical protein Acsp03_72290 [Actinomadura sp. NBRC 104412]|nr:hypothetical protein Acsp03_72290 [Actinomadura sp. NBRC 104412]
MIADDLRASVRRAGGSSLRPARNLHQPDLLLPADGKHIASFRLTLSSVRGIDETGFVRSIDSAMDGFHQSF